MKANKKFRSEEEAVSAVIGVILMVAITVAIAATVYYYVTVMMPAGETTTPTFQLTREETLDRLVVTQADEEADWDRLSIYLEEDVVLPVTSIDFDLNANAAEGVGSLTTGGTSGKLKATNGFAGTANLMSAGEFIEFAAVGGAATEITVIIVDDVANQVIGSYTFIDIAV
jgi:flagellin-like protein